jgi:hypothetical protein
MWFRVLALVLLALVGVSAQTGTSTPSSPSTFQAPRFWNDRELADWATPVAGLNVRPGHFSERDYYAAPSIEWVRTFPVPGHQFGLRLSDDEKAALIAFLKTL